MFDKISKYILISLFIFAAITPLNSPANAQSCTNYYEMKRQIQKEKGEFLWKWKGTLTALGGCMVACKDQPSSDQTACYIAACSLTCLVVGVDNCFSVFNEGAAISQKESEIKKYGIKNGCT